MEEPKKESQPEDCLYLVGGQIGVGKSTLLQRASEAGCNAFPELLNQEQFRDYVRHPEHHAYGFQVSMMLGASARTQNARQMKNFGASVTVIERGAQENLVFALANYAMGWMTHEQFSTYERYADDLLLRPELLPERERSVQLFLWAPQQDIAARMDDRAREGEDEYTEDYISRLGEAYFACVLDSFSKPTSSNPKWRLPYVVVDWRSYGTWSDLMNRDILKGSVRREGHNVRYVIHDQLHDGGGAVFLRDAAPLFEDNSDATKDLVGSELESEAARLGVPDAKMLKYRHRRVRKRIDESGLHLDLSWYLNVDVSQNTFAATFFRDIAYEAMAANFPVIFHVRDTDFGRELIADRKHPERLLLDKIIINDYQNRKKKSGRRTMM